MDWTVHTLPSKFVYCSYNLHCLKMWLYLEVITLKQSFP